MAATAPRQSFIIWFSQRVGSTMLTQALEDTGLAGRPGEWFNIPGTTADLLAHYRARDAFELREAFWRDGVTNGVFGVKYGFGEKLHADLTALFTQLLPLGTPDPEGRAAWEAVLPNCKHVFLTRRNKLRLAVSWWRAIRSEDWHRPSRPERTVVDPATGPVPERITRPTPANLVDQYDYNALETLLLGANLREAGMQDRFDRWAVVPHNIFYEDLIATHEPTVRNLLDYLEVPGRENIPIPAPAFARLADEVAETWYHRFREDLERRGT
jgi:trehalose 2-sulfotransferase